MRAMTRRDVAAYTDKTLTSMDRHPGSWILLAPWDLLKHMELRKVLV